LKDYYCISVVWSHLIGRYTNKQWVEDSEA